MERALQALQTITLLGGGDSPPGASDLFPTLADQPRDGAEPGYQAPTPHPAPREGAARPGGKLNGTLRDSA